MTFFSMWRRRLVSIILEEGCNSFYSGLSLVSILAAELFLFKFRWTYIQELSVSNLVRLSNMICGITETLALSLDTMFVELAVGSQDT